MRSTHTQPQGVEEPAGVTLGAGSRRRGQRVEKARRGPAMDGRPFSLRQDVESETPARTSEPGGGEALRHEPRSGYPYAGGTADVLAVRVPPGGFDHV